MGTKISQMTSNRPRGLERIELSAPNYLPNGDVTESLRTTAATEALQIARFAPFRHIINRHVAPAAENGVFTLASISTEVLTRTLRMTEEGIDQDVNYVLDPSNYYFEAAHIALSYAMSQGAEETGNHPSNAAVKADMMYHGYTESWYLSWSTSKGSVQELRNVNTTGLAPNAAVPISASLTSDGLSITASFQSSDYDAHPTTAFVFGYMDVVVSLRKKITSGD